MTEDVFEGTAPMIEAHGFAMAMRGKDGLVETAEDIGVGGAYQHSILVGVMATENVRVSRNLSHAQAQAHAPSDDRASFGIHNDAPNILGAPGQCHDQLHVIHLFGLQDY